MRAKPGGYARQGAEYRSCKNGAAETRVREGGNSGGGGGGARGSGDRHAGRVREGRGAGSSDNRYYISGPNCPRDDRYDSLRPNCPRERISWDGIALRRKEAAEHGLGGAEGVGKK